MQRLHEPSCGHVECCGREKIRESTVFPARCLNTGFNRQRARGSTVGGNHAGTGGASRNKKTATYAPGVEAAGGRRRESDAHGTAYN